MPFDSYLVKSALQNFEVVYEFIVMFGLPVDLGEGNFAWVDNIENLAVDCPGAQLLDFG